MALASTITTSEARYRFTMFIYFLGDITFQTFIGFQDID